MQIVSNFNMSANKCLDNRKSWNSLADLKANTTLLMPNGFLAYCKAENEWYKLNCTNEKDTSTYSWEKFKVTISTATNEEIKNHIATLYK